MIKKIASLIILMSFQYSLAEDTKFLTEKSIAIVDMQHILTESIAAKALREEVDKKSAEYEKSAKKLEEDLTKNNQELTKQRSVLSEEAYGEKVREFENKILDAQRLTQEKKMNLAQGLENSMAEISKAIYDITTKVTDEQKLTLVVPKELVITRNCSDITNEILTRLNKQLVHVNLVIENSNKQKK